MEVIRYVLETAWDVINTFAGLYWQMVHDWPLGVLLSIPITIALLILLAMALYCLFYLFDKHLGEKMTGVGAVIGKDFKQDHTEYMLSPVPVPWMMPIYYSAELWIGVKITNVGESWMSVNRSFYYVVDIGRRVKVDYNIGFFTGKIYLRYLETV